VFFFFQDFLRLLTNSIIGRGRSTGPAPRPTSNGHSGTTLAFFDHCRIVRGKKPQHTVSEHTTTKKCQRNKVETNDSKEDPTGLVYYYGNAHVER